MRTNRRRNVEHAYVPSNLNKKDPLHIDDLRPYLKLLNWQLRRVGVALCVLAEDDGRISGVYIGPSVWIVTCDFCGEKYEPGRERVPTCPKCGAKELP